MDRAEATFTNNEELQRYLHSASHWEERYRRLLQLASRASDESPAKIPEHRVTGCTARVWLAAAGTPDDMRFIYTTDSRLVRALLVVLLQPVQNQPATDIARFDFHTWLESCGLSQHLSPSRANGVTAVSQAVRELALSWQASQA